MIIVKKEKIIPIQRYRHPWIYQNSIQDVAGTVAHGDIVPIADPEKNIIGYGFYSAKSRIACRVISFNDRIPDDWITQKITGALALRTSPAIDSNAFRLINAEGDFFPGLTIDIYNDVCVIKPSILGTEKLIDEISRVLEQLFPSYHIFLKRDEKASRIECMTRKTGFIKGSTDTTVLIHENSIQYLVDIMEGQKTGFYLDQRNNRTACRTFAAQKKVLNLFSYTGGFALSALAGGAASAISVDASQAALALGEKNAALNNFIDGSKATWIKADVFDYLETAESADMIICDPPPFAGSKKDRDNAIRGYKQLNLMVLKKLSSNGVLFTFSCSQTVTKEILFGIISEAGRKIGRNIRIIGDLNAPADHPYSSLHPEGEYLKGFIVYAE